MQSLPADRRNRRQLAISAATTAVALSKFSIQGAGVCFSIQVCPTRVVREIGNSLGWMLDLHRFANETVKLESALGMLSKTLPWGFNKSIERGFMTRRSVQFMALLGLVLVVSACAVSADKEMNHDD